MNKITEIVAEHLKDSEFTDFFNRNYFPEEADFIKKFDHLIEFYSFYSQLAPYALYECSEDECLPEAIVKEIVNEIDWHEVRETWADYNRC
jgi:hypothetical protein